jgi:hypothetical protein
MTGQDKALRAFMEQEKRKIEMELSRQMFGADARLTDGMAFAPRPVPVTERVRRRLVSYLLGWKEAVRGVWMAARGRFDYVREDEWDY